MATIKKLWLVAMTHGYQQEIMVGYCSEGNGTPGPDRWPHYDKPPEKVSGHHWVCHTIQGIQRIWVPHYARCQIEKWHHEQQKQPSSESSQGCKSYTVTTEVCNPHTGSKKASTGKATEAETVWQAPRREASAIDAIKWEAQAGRKASTGGTTSPVDIPRWTFGKGEAQSEEQASTGETTTTEEAAWRASRKC